MEAAAQDPHRPRVVVLGGGFAGLNAARALAGVDADVTLIDRHNVHVFQPLLYQVATAGLAAPDISAPIRKVLKGQRNATVLLGTAVRIDVESRRVVLTDGSVPYDVLVMAAGAVPTWFGHDEWARHAPGLKDCDDALTIRRRILLAYEAAERESDPARRAPWLTFVVIGAGPTGVELAGALADIARHTLARDFRGFDPKDSRIVLLEAGERVLPTFPDTLSRAAADSLARLGIEVRTGHRVTGVDERGVDVGAERFDSHTVVWAAGVRAEPITASLGAPLDRQGRVLVEPDLSVPGHPEILVVGDAAAMRWEDAAVGEEREGEHWVPGMAPAAIQSGRHAAANVRARLAGRATRPFRYRDKGMLATIGRSSAVAHIAGLRVSGLFAWVLWALVHVAFLIGFRNRFVVLFEWTWLYFSKQRSARVILDRQSDSDEIGAD
jgi:NADH dehydrogenase